MKKGPNMQEQYANKATASGHSYSTAEDMKVDGLDALEDRELGLWGESNSSPRTLALVLPKPPKPPMSKSNQKVLQLTGHDMRYDRALVEERSQFTVSGDFSSSESGHSQDGNRPGIPERDTSSVSAITPGESSQISLRSSIYATRDRSTTPSAIAPIRGKGSEFPMEHAELQAIPPFRKGIVRTHSTEPVTFSVFIAETQSSVPSGYEQDDGTRYRQGMADPNMAHLAPAALALRPKSEREQFDLDTRRNYIFSNARGSMNWGIQELTGGPTVRRREPPILENLGLPPPKSSRKRIFSSGKHPPKSPYPFYTSRENSWPEESESKISKRLSSVIKRISGGKSLPPKTTPLIISNSARTANGPDTQIPVKSGFMSNVDIGDAVHHGNEHLAEVYARAKKNLRIKTGDEKRRESLKKQIVVLGIADQSPDGRIAEWL